MSPNDHERWEDDLAAWALGALEPGEAKRFERHLARCERCRADLRWLRPAVDALPAAVTQVAPPPRLRGELLATVRSEARRGDVPRRGRWPGWLSIPRPALAALGAAALVAAGIAGYALRGDSDEATYQAEATRAAQGAEAELVVKGDDGTLEASDMPRLPRDQVFQAWIQEGGDGPLRPSTVFVAEQGGSATATIPDVEGAVRVMVTREPRGGSEQPTTAPMMRFELG
jgi:anti-sigma-K factor RskA